MKSPHFLRFFLRLMMLVSILLLGKGYHLATDGFRKEKIFPSEKFSPFCSHSPIKPEDERIFDQPFFYLNHGGQVFCFVSQDGKAVLKLLRHHKYRIPLWVDLFSFCKSGKMQKEKEKKYRNFIYQRTLKSYMISETDLKEETGSLFIHLAKTENLHKKVIVFDKLHRKHLLDLDSTFFLLQKKADGVLGKVLLEKKEKGELIEAQRLLSSFFSTFFQMMEKKISIRDPNWMINFGVRDNQVQIIDLGAFVCFEEGKDFREWEGKTRWVVKKLQKWLFFHYPDLLPFVEKEAEKQLLVQREKVILQENTSP